MRQILKIFGWIFLVLVIALIALAGYLRSVSTLSPPEVNQAEFHKVAVKQVSADDRRSGNSFLFKNADGNWEMYLEGSPFERGVVNGKLSADLLYVQEMHFINQIRELVPDERYLNFLKYLVGFFNRHMNDHVQPDFQREIYGVALSMPDTFDFVSDKYDRAMNYHAAHDIGHALQNLALVGCTSFAARNPENGTLIAGRNFDFYVGDGFAENKIVALVKPDSGYAYLSVTWPGMIGVVSGMNAAGLSISLNAAPSEVPPSSATPISILAREILQYASTIDEALAIAQKRQTFVSESLLIVSAEDQHAAIIEKTPGETAVFRPEKLPLVCSNHFQSQELKQLPINKQWIENSDSRYRHELMSAMLDTSGRNPDEVAQMLRYRGGLDGQSLGLGNPMAINQLIAHHGVIFQPEERLVWVSSSPFQEGAFAAYDLKTIFGASPPSPGESMAVDSLKIPQGEFLNEKEWVHFQEYRAWIQQMRKAMRNRNYPFSQSEIDAAIALNPDYYLGYLLAAEYFSAMAQHELASGYANKALGLMIPYKEDRDKLIKLLQNQSADEI
jgi:hypothetical protein